MKQILSLRSIIPFSISAMSRSIPFQYTKPNANCLKLISSTVLSLKTYYVQSIRWGHRKHNMWTRKKLHDHPQHFLNINRPRPKGPTTPSFPDGVEYQQINDGFEFKKPYLDHGGTRRKIYLSVKRGRKLGLSRYKVVKKKANIK